MNQKPMHKTNEEQRAIAEKSPYSYTRLPFEEPKPLHAPAGWEYNQ